MTIPGFTICPWCGTYYQIFQPNCRNCGGPILPSEIEPEEGEGFAMPPPPPRPVPDSYFWKLLFNDSWGIIAFIFAILGACFSFLGVVLTVAVVTAFVGLPFLGLGLLFLSTGVIGLIMRGQEMKNIVLVLQHGLPLRGEITGIEENQMVSVNNRHPWKISYQFMLDGRMFEGEKSTLNIPSPTHQPGRTVCVLFLKDKPEINTIYPHP